MNKKELAMLLSELEEIKPKKELEQYQTPSEIAADLLWTAFLRGDLRGRVADLGCGNGIFGIGAKLLGAKEVYCVERDEDSLEVAERNARKLGVDIKFLLMDVRDFEEEVDTVVMNPPFGRKPHHLDRVFLEKAFEIADIVYSVHPASSAQFLLGFGKKYGFSGEVLKEFDFPLRATFPWHRKKVERFKAVFLRFQRESRMR
ncbi:MAG TPA: methyltransferase domain-containing protein [Candidatus Aenigmarchaeota archaeon]|nr:methyltransferase domain-containing protein [Candidatus Aenigmarchaeota archaeon]